MKIAICDDTPKDMESMIKYIKEYATLNKLNFEIIPFSNSITFLNHLKLVGTNEYDLLILDVVMQDNGIDVANKIREFDKDIRIIFYSTSKDFAIDAFKVRAFDYLLKPLKKENVFQCLDELKIKPTLKTVIQIKSEDLSLISVNIKDIIYIESKDRKMQFFTNDKKSITTTSIRTKFLEAIPFDYEQFEFVNCHSSYVVNMNYIKAIDTNEFILKDGTIIPISRRIFPQVKEKYINHLIGEQ